MNHRTPGSAWPRWILAGVAALGLTGCVAAATNPGTPTTFASESTPASADPAPDRSPNTSEGLVVHVIDGDTIVVRLTAEVEERVRLIGIDSPETGECFYAEATQGLVSLVEGEMVYLERDVSDRDRFGRLLRYVWSPHDRLVNEVVVDEGWAIARVYPPDNKRSARLHAAEDRARAAGVGLWAADVCGSGDHRDIQWVVFDNRGASPIDMTG